MGITKSELFSDKKNTLATMFKVLAHPARLAILQYIINQKSLLTEAGIGNSEKVTYDGAIRSDSIYWLSY